MRGAQLRSNLDFSSVYKPRDCFASLAMTANLIFSHLLSNHDSGGRSMERTQPGTGNAVVRRMKAAFTWGARESSAASVSSAPAQDAHAQYGVPQGASEAGISRDSSLQHCPASSAYPAAAGATATEMISKHTRTSEGPRKNMSHYKAAPRASQRRIWSCTEPLDTSSQAGRRETPRRTPLQGPLYEVFLRLPLGPAVPA